MSDCGLIMKYNGKNILGIGFEEGGGIVEMSGCSYDLRLEGIHCYALGSIDKQSRISLNKCKGTIHVAASDPHIFNAKEDLVTMTDCDIYHYEGS